jgi:hypothetical protein
LAITVIIDLTEQQMRDLQQIARQRSVDASQAAGELLTESLVDLMRRALPMGESGRVIAFKGREQ